MACIHVNSMTYMYLAMGAPGKHRRGYLAMSLGLDDL